MGEALDDIRQMIAGSIAFHLEGIAVQGEPVPPRKMSFGDAMAYHIECLAEADEPVPDTETTFLIVEIEDAQPATSL